MLDPGWLADKVGVCANMCSIEKQCHERLLRLIRDAVVDGAQETTRTDMLVNEYTKMIQPAIDEFGPERLLDRELIDELSRLFSSYHNSRKTVNGDAVGILAAQSIGETGTQLSLNSFHSVGHTNSTLSQGVPRLKALIDASKSKHPVHILKTSFKDVVALDNTVGTLIRDVKLRHLIKFVDVIDNTLPLPDWHNEWLKNHGELSPKIDKSTIVRFYLDHDNMFFFKVSPKMIELTINDSFQRDSVVAMASPVELGMLDVFIQPPKEDMKTDPKLMLVLEKHTRLDKTHASGDEGTRCTLPEDSERFVYDSDDDTPPQNFIHRIRPARCLGSRYTAQVLLKLSICGKKDVTKTEYSKEEDDTWSICAFGGSLGDLCSLPFVDETQSTSACVHQICEHFGIAAACMYLQRELHKVTGEGVSIAHTQLVASFMTFQGSVKSMTRYTMRNQSGALCRAAFEEPVDMLVSAAINGEIDDLSGCSSAIICGKAPKVGTNGNIDLLYTSPRRLTTKSANSMIFSNDTDDGDMEENFRDSDDSDTFEESDDDEDDSYESDSDTD